ncbi:MAG: hypothetical protein FWG70_06005 [Oscillospiraceae bacterium]|nr:hypothetical protein [Oscillospiraceae bacterium]
MSVFVVVAAILIISDIPQLRQEKRHGNFIYFAMLTLVITGAGFYFYG